MCKQEEEREMKRELLLPVSRVLRGRYGACNGAGGGACGGAGGRRLFSCPHTHRSRPCGYHTHAHLWQYDNRYAAPFISPRVNLLVAACTCPSSFTARAFETPNCNRVILLCAINMGSVHCRRAPHRYSAHRAISLLCHAFLCISPSWPACHHYASSKTRSRCDLI